MKAVYIIENLDCPNCAMKIESAIQKLEEIEEASLSYPTKQLHITAEKIEGLLEKLQSVADSVEDGVIISEQATAHLDKAPYPSHVHERRLQLAELMANPQTMNPEKTEAPEQHLETENILLIVGAVLFAIGMVLHFAMQNQIIANIFLIVAYLLMGWEVLTDSIKSIGKGQIFDENFLMTIATIGAICVGSFEEAGGVMLFFRLGELFEHIAVERSRKSVMSAIDMRPETIELLLDGKTYTIPAEYAEPFDRILVRAGDRIPVDGIVVKGESSLDTSAVTGEPVPIAVKEGSEIMSGCVNLDGVIELEAAASVNDSMVQRIMDSVENAAAGKPKLDRFITRFARVYTPIVVVIAVLTAIVPSMVTGNWGHWVYTALNFLMISCPCALVLSVPLAYFSGIGAGSAKGILFKDGQSLEALAKVKAVVMDKTGTLTKGTFSVTELETDSNQEQLLQYTASCESVSNHPIAKSILAYAKEQKLTIFPVKDVQEIAGKGIQGIVNGHQVLCGNETLMKENGLTAPKINMTCVYTAIDGEYMGCVKLSDTLKEHSVETVQALNNMQIHTVMLTGDSPAHTKAIAEQLQIQEVHAGLLPTEKPIHMEQVRKEKGAVLFVGDGINDAPVLSGADVGASMGSGSDAAIESADMVLLNSDPIAILQSLEIAKRVNVVAIVCVVFALAVKLAVMISGFMGYANMWVSAFADTGVTILCILIVFMGIYLHYRKRS
ncbi:MAG: heavy metal translocating P-type ATPase [Oscillospiraceae bacterium]